MGIMASKQQKAAGPAKRRSTQLDFSNLGPLKKEGTVGFSAFRDSDGPARRNKARKKSNGSLVGGEMDEDSDDEDDEAAMKMEEVDDKDLKSMLSPEDAKRQGELAEGVDRIKVSVSLPP